MFVAYSRKISHSRARSTVPAGRISSKYFVESVPLYCHPRPPRHHCTRSPVGARPVPGPSWYKLCTTKNRPSVCDSSSNSYYPCQSHSHSTPPWYVSYRPKMQSTHTPGCASTSRCLTADSVAKSRSWLRPRGPRQLELFGPGLEDPIRVVPDPPHTPYWWTDPRTTAGQCWLATTGTVPTAFSSSTSEWL